jgi:hypothetical protein
MAIGLRRSGVAVRATVSQSALSSPVGDRLFLPINESAEVLPRRC